MARPSRAFIEWDEDKLEPRTGVIDRVDVYRFHVAGCKPRIGDWVQIGDDKRNALVLEHDQPEDLLRAFPYWYVAPQLGEPVVIVGPVTMPR